MRGGYGQSNLRQYPIFLECDNTEGASSLSGDNLSDNQLQYVSGNVAPDQRGTRSSKRQALRPAPSRPLPVSIAYPDCATSEKFALLLNLMPLTGLRLGIAKFSSLKSNPARSGDPFSVSNLGNPKLAHFITSRYEDVPALRYATDCVVAKVRQVLRYRGGPFSDGKDTILLHYTKAIKALQAALEDETQSMAEETLCATELLAVFEVRTRL